MKTTLILLIISLSTFQKTFSQPGWFSVNTGTNVQLNSISSKGNNAWAVGNNGTILRTTNGGENWTTQPSGTVYNLNSIFFRPDTVGFIAGNGGTILRSMDFGATWQPMSTGTTANLNCIWPLFDTLTVLAAGDNGTILITYNRGVSWVSRTAPVNVNFKCIVSGWPNDIFIAGENGKIIHSVDLGLYWNEQQSGTSNSINSLSAKSLWSFTSIVHAVGNNGTILKTTNSGMNWVSIPGGTNENLRSVSTQNVSGDSLNYFIAAGSNSKLIESIDGDIWVNRPVPSGGVFNSLWMENMNRGFICGNNGLVLRSIGNYYYAYGTNINTNNINTVFRNDGGFNGIIDTVNSPGFEWPKGSGLHARYASGICIGAVINGMPQTVTAMYMNEYYPGYTNSSGVPQGRNDTNYRIFKLNEGSLGNDRTNWPNALLGNSDQGAPVFFDSASNSWKPLDMGGQTVFSSFTDSYPESHTNYFGGLAPPLKADVHQLSFSVNIPGVLANVVFTQHTIINRSSSVWQDAYISVWSDDDLGDGTNDKLGCDSALGMGYTYNGYNSDPVYGSAPPAVAFLMLKGASLQTGSPLDTIRYCNNRTAAFKTGYRDLGMTVFNFTINGNINFSDPENFLESYNLIAGYYKNGSNIYNPAGGFITKLTYSGNPVTQTGWLASAPDDYRMYLSTGPVTMNPGDTQVIVTAQLIGRGNSYLNSITVLRSYVNEIRGFYKSCYNDYTIGLSNNSEVIRKFSLSQNYPNPFNPVTKINYSLPFSCIVYIRVFDVTGRELLSNSENKTAGEHSFDFDGTNYSSGVYFYSIQAVSKTGSFTETKKMVLLK